MTRLNAHFRPRYAPLYVVAIVALLTATASWTSRIQAGTQTQAMDVSAIMATIDTGSLPVQGHVDAF
jgi:hypothetical protein